MLELHIEGQSVWDENKEEFYNIPSCDLKLEHSLASISKWEAKYHMPYLNTKDKTIEQTLDYVAMMNVGEPIKDFLSLRLLTNEQIMQIHDYIDDPMTATTFSKEDEEAATKKTNKFVTSEEIYYWMTTQNIPFECQHWHFNRLITLIKVCAINNKPEDKKPKKLTSTELAKRRAQMEEARKRFSKH